MTVCSPTFSQFEFKWIQRHNLFSGPLVLVHISTICRHWYGSWGSPKIVRQSWFRDNSVELASPVWFCDENQRFISIFLGWKPRFSWHFPDPQWGAKLFPELRSPSSLDRASDGKMWPRRPVLGWKPWFPVGVTFLWGTKIMVSQLNNIKQY